MLMHALGSKYIGCDQNLGIADSVIQKDLPKKQLRRKLYRQACADISTGPSQKACIAYMYD